MEEGLEVCFLHESSAQIEGKILSDNSNSSDIVQDGILDRKNQHENEISVGCMVKLDEIRLEMRILERVVEKMMENRLRWFENVERRSMYSIVKIVDQIAGSQTTRGRG